MDWLEIFLDIMLDKPVNPVAMGFIGAISASVALIFNNYSWRRAAILTIMALSSVMGWQFIRALILGDDIKHPIAQQDTVFTFILVIFLVAGYWAAGIVNYFKPNPGRRLKRLIIAGLRKTAYIIPSYRLSRPLEKKADKLEIKVEEQKKEETLDEQEILERMKNVIAMFL